MSDLLKKSGGDYMWNGSPVEGIRRTSLDGEFLITGEALSILLTSVDLLNKKVEFTVSVIEKLMSELKEEV